MESMPSPIPTSIFNQRAQRRWIRGAFSLRGMSGLLFGCKILERWLVCIIKLCSGKSERERTMQSPLRGYCNASRRKPKSLGMTTKPPISIDLNCSYLNVPNSGVWSLFVNQPHSAYFARLHWMYAMQKAWNGKDHWHYNPIEKKSSEFERVADVCDQKTVGRDSNKWNRITAMQRRSSSQATRATSELTSDHRQPVWSLELQSFQSSNESRAILHH